MLKSIISEQYMTIVRTIEIILLVLLIPLLYNFFPIDKKASETFYIDAANKESIVDSLEENGYTVTFVDKIMIQTDKMPQSGWYTLDKHKYGRFNFFRNIYKYQAETMDIVIYAGETHDELLDRLANDLKLDRDRLYEQYKARSRFKEADIFAGQYRVARKADERSVMVYLFSVSNKMLALFIEKTFKNRPDHFGLKVLLTIASIIQKESNSAQEMPLISSVIHNRLAKNMRLQMDSTLNYGTYSHTIVTPERIKTDTSYYNTYKHKGLPPYPLGTVSLDALRAAMFPEKNAYLFFMLKPDGGHKFCATYDEHLENIRKFRAYQKQKQKEKEEQKKKAEKEKREKALADANKTSTENNDSNHNKLSSDKNITVSGSHSLKSSTKKVSDPVP